MVKKYCCQFFIILAALLSTKSSFAQQVVTDYLNVPGPVLFGNANYYLAWSSRPVDNYYKQEYLAKGDSLEHFSKLVLIDVLEDTIKPKELVLLKLKDLKERKKTDAVVNYNLIQSPDSTEYIVDFVESEGVPKTDFVEWNAYLYKAFKDINGHKGVMLFGISIRSYGNTAADFFGSLRDLREHIINQLIAYTVPQVNIQ